jgi:hypothetical protein
MGQKATQSFNDPENRHHSITRAYEVEPTARDGYNIDELCASAHFYEALDGLRKTKAN